VSHPRAYPRCVFCGARANSREHAIPAWIAKRFGFKGLYLENAVVVGVKHIRKQPISVASHRARIFCSDCNTFFKHLEDQVADTLTWMARGRPLQLDTEQIALLGCWGAKTGVALLAAEKDFVDLVPEAHRRYLRERETPDDHCWVGYSSWNGGINKFGGEQLVGAPELGAAETPYRAYAAVLTFAQLAVKLFGLIDSPIPGYAIGRDTDSFRQFWPPKHLSLKWPLFPVAQEGNLDDLIEFAPMTKLS